MICIMHKSKAHKIKTESRNGSAVFFKGLCKFSLKGSVGPMASANKSNTCENFTWRESKLKLLKVTN